MFTVKENNEILVRELDETKRKSEIIRHENERLTFDISYKNRELMEKISEYDLLKNKYDDIVNRSLNQSRVNKLIL